MSASDVYARLGDLARVLRGVTYSKAEAGSAPAQGMTPVLRATNIGDELSFDGLVYVPDRRVSETQRLRPGDSVLAASSGSASVVGKSALVRAPWRGSFGAFCYAVRPHADLVQPAYLAYYLRSSEYRRQVSRLALGVNINNLRRGHLEDLSLRVFPMREQHRIVAALDSYFTRLDDATATLERLQANLKRYRASVLKAAVEGRLVPTEAELARTEGREYETGTTLVGSVDRPARPARFKSRSRDVIPGHPSLAVGNPGTPLPEGWCWAALVDVARLESGHTPSRRHPEWWGGDVPWMGIPDARAAHGGVVYETAQRTNAEGLANSAARLLPARTVCLTRTASVGYVVEMGIPMATSQDFVNWTCTPALDPAWLRCVLMADRDALRRFGKGTTHTTIYFPEVLSLHIAVPPLSEQARIAQRVDELTSAAEAQERTVQVARTRTIRLRQSILKWAFEGRLVDQDPNDEPASALLERIRQEREAAAAKPKAKRVTRKRKAKS